MEYFVGIDLHRQFFTVHGTDEKGNDLLKGKFSNSLESLDKVLSAFPTLPKVVVEATINWMWLVVALQERGCAVKLAHPFRTKAIAAARIKTDTIDAKTLCHLLRTDMVPSSYIASPEEIENRELSRGRIDLVHKQTHTRNRIHSLLGKENLNFPGTDLFGAKGRVWLKTQRLPEAKRIMINLYLKELASLKGLITKVDKVIKVKSRSLPEIKVLESIPGIGTTTAFLLASEIGDINRFDDPKHFASYFGLVPRLSQSGGHAYYGRITKLGNPYVRWSLVQVAHRLARTDREYQKFVSRISFKGGKKKAIVALTRKLATIVFRVLKDNRLYLPIPEYRQKAWPGSIPGS